MRDQILKRLEEVYPDFVTFRRELHQYPELFVS